MVHQVYKVFLASPSDVDNERELARKVVDYTNKEFESFNIHLELYGWEYVRSQFGRPQATINDYLNKCDLFIGLLWRRFGSPSGKDALTGFEEEYEEACSMKRAGQIDQVKLFFKEISRDYLSDIGPQLREVLNFKKKIKESKTIYYEEFKDENEWEVVLGKNLRHYVISKINKEEPPPTSSPIQAPISETSEGVNETKASENVTQIIESLNKTLKFLTDGDELKKDTNARLFLFSSALFYGDNLRTEVLKTHEIQYIYKIRKHIVPIRQERKLILRTVIDDRHEVSAGWFFFDILNHETLELILVHLSFDDPSENIRLQALNYVYKLSNFSHIDALINAFENYSEDEQVAILKAISKLGNLQHIYTLDAIIKNHPSLKIVKAAWRSKLELLIREDKQAAIELIKDTPLDKRANLSEYIDELLLFSDKSLLKVLRHDIDTNLQLEIIKYVPEEYSDDELKKILSHLIEPENVLSPATLKNDYKIRAVALKELVRRGEITDMDVIHDKLLYNEFSGRKTDGILPDLKKIDADKYIKVVLIELYKRKSYDELYNKLDWYTHDDFLKYEAMVEIYYDEFKDTLHQDIEGSFKRIKDMAIDQLTRERDSFIERFPEQKNGVLEKYEKIIKGLGELDDFIKSNYLNSALKALSRIRKTLPIELSRKILKYDLGLYRSDIISNLLDSYLENGTIEDIGDLKDLLSEGELYADINKKLCEVLVSIDKENKENTIQYLLDTGNQSLLKKLFSIMSEEIDDGILIKIKELLYHTTDNIRLISLAYLLRKMNDDELIELLEKYPMRDGTYYYNVMCWLDRCLYAPGELKEHFRTELQAKLT